MHVDLPMLGVLFLLVCVIIGRVILVKARKKIPETAQLELFQSFAKVRAFAIMPVAALLACFIVFSHFSNITKADLVGFMAVLALITIITQVMVYRKFIQSDLPRNYLLSQSISAGLTLLGVLGYIATVVFSG